MKDGVPIITYNFPETWVGGKYYYPHALELSEDLQVYIYHLSSISGTDYLSNLALISHESGCQENAYNYYYDKNNVKHDVYGLMQVVGDYWGDYTSEGGSYYNNHQLLREYAENSNVDLLLNDYDGVYNPYTNIYVGVAAHAEWMKMLNTAETKDYQALIGKYGNGKTSQATYEILFYRDSLAVLIGEGTWYVDDLYTESGERK